MRVSQYSGERGEGRTVGFMVTSDTRLREELVI